MAPTLARRGSKSQAGFYDGTLMATLDPDETFKPTTGYTGHLPGIAHEIGKRHSVAARRSVENIKTMAGGHPNYEFARMSHRSIVFEPDNKVAPEEAGHSGYSGHLPMLKAQMGRRKSFEAATGLEMFQRSQEQKQYEREAAKAATLQRRLVPVGEYPKGEFQSRRHSTTLYMGKLRDSSSQDVTASTARPHTTSMSYTLNSPAYPLKPKGYVWKIPERCW